MSTNNERDTKFLGFAKLLSDDIQKALRAASDTENLFALEHTIIAQRAYDLLYYALEHDPHCYSPSDAILSIPDMTELP